MDNKLVCLFNCKRDDFASLQKEEEETLLKIKQEYALRRREIVWEQLRILTSRTLPIKENLGYRVIASLVSKIEGKCYIWKEKEISVHKRMERTMFGEQKDGTMVLRLYPEIICDERNSEFENVNYTLIYLVEQDKEKQAEKEIGDKFEGADYCSVEKLFGGINENYLELAHYENREKSEFYENIDFYLTDDYEEYYTDFSRLRDEVSLVLKTKIEDPKFSYISLFLDYVLEYNIKKVNSSFDEIIRPLSSDELYLLVNDFVMEYRKNNGINKLTMKNETI